MWRRPLAQSGFLFKLQEDLGWGVFKTRFVLAKLNPRSKYGYTTGFIIETLADLYKYFRHNDRIG